MVGWSSAVFAHELPPCSAGFDSENGLYLFALTVPDRAVLVSGAVAAETAAPLIPLGTHALRGIASPCAVFTVPER